MKLKLLAIFLTIVVILDLVLYVLNRINTLTFWIIMIFCAIMAYKVIPYLRNK